MKLTSIALFLIIVNCSCSTNGKRAESNKDTSSDKINTRIASASALHPAQPKTTFDSLQGVWIADEGDSSDNRKLIIKGDSIYFSAQNQILESDRFYISKIDTYNKEDILPQIKTGKYFIYYSSAINDISRCDKIDTLTKNKLVFFLKDLGRHGVWEGYHK